MTLAQRVFHEKRGLVLALAVALAANAAIYLVAVMPLAAKVRSAEERAAQAAQSAQRGEALFGAARATIAGKERADEELAKFYTTILPADLAGARRITYLRLAQLAERAQLRYERRTVTAEAEPDSALSKLNMTMVLAGEYGNIRRFIHDLETAPEFLVIEDVALAQNEEGTGPLVLTLEVSTYYRTGGHGG